MTLALVITGLIGLAAGIWLGMPGRYRQTSDDIGRIMDAGGGRRRKVKRVFTPLAWMQRNVSARSKPSRDRRRGRSRRSGFSLESPDEK